MRRFILFLIKFTNQKTNAEYYFTECNLMKVYSGWTQLSHVSINWILDDNCKIEKI